MEHDIERLLFPLQELDVVNEQDVDILIARLEVLETGLLAIMSGRCVHIVAQQFSRVDVMRLQVRLRLLDMVLDCTQKVRFPTSAAPVDEQWVELRFPWGFCNGDRHGVCHAV